MKKHIFYSLKNRYAIVSITLIILVLTSAIAGYKIVYSSQEQATKNSTYRSDVLENNRLLRNAVWNSRAALQEFLLEPGINNSQEKIHTELLNANTQINNLIKKSPINKPEFTHIFSAQKNHIEALILQIDIIIKTRLNASQQYPALAVASGIMLPNQNKFYAAVENKLNRMFEKNADAHSHETYRQYEDARQKWSELISNFRLYLSNRLGSFNEANLPFQEENNKKLILSVEKILNGIAQESSNTSTGTSTLSIMKESLSLWKEGYQKVEDIHHSGAWRTDKNILINNIKPLYSRLWILSQTTEHLFRQLAENDVDNLNDISKVQLQLILSITSISILLISLGYYFLNRSILHPIARLTHALKEETNGNKQCDLPIPNTQETEDLLSAFVTMQKEIHEQRDGLKHQTLHDSLTGLANRSLMSERLKHAIAIAKRQQHNPALLMMDLNGFKDVNDSLGHQVGDELLVAIADRLKNALRETDTVARLGGDEFAVLVDDITLKGAMRLSSKILSIIQKPFQLSENQLHISASIGIATYPSHGDSETTLVRHADIAMYHAKRNKLGAVIYDQKFDEDKTEKLSLIADLRQAIEKDELELYFQPKVSLKNNLPTGFEALLRWNHPTNGFIPPDEIIIIAEQSGLINNIFEWVFNQACRYNKQWQQNGLDINISVNLSVHDLQHYDIVKSIKKTLAEYVLSPRSFTAEVTEGAMMENPEQAIKKLTALDQMGIKVSIDDYGTGYSSLSYLKRLPVEELKIDKSFVLHMDVDANDAIIVKSTIDLAHNLGLKVVAEGIENEFTLGLLTKWGCDTVQGYYFSRPMPADQVEQWIIDYNKKSQSDSPST